MSLADEVATLREQVESLKRMVQMRALWSTPSSRPPASVVRRVTMEAHGFTVGTWVRSLEGVGGNWVADVGRPQAVGAQSSCHNRLSGVISRVYSIDEFEITTAGSVTGISNPEDTVDGVFEIGKSYRLSDTVVGTVTVHPTSTGLECFHATGPNEGIVIHTWQSTGYLTRDSVIGDSGQVISGSVLADPATVTDHHSLRVIVSVDEEEDSQLECHAGWCQLPEDTLTDTGLHWLDPDSPGDLTSIKPTTPEDQRPIAVLYHYGDGWCWVKPTPMSEPGIGDLWDVDHSTPPADGDGLVWDDTAKRYVPEAVLPTLADGPSVLARIEDGEGPVVAFQVTVPWGVMVDNGSNQLEWKLLTPDHLADFPAYSVLANETDAAAPAIHLEAPDGTVLARVGDVMGFGSDPELGTAAGGEGYLKIHFAAGKYFEFAADGTFKIYHSAALSLEVNSSGKVTLTYASSNTVVIDPADIVGTSRQFKIRELDVCDPTGVAKKIQLICTAMY